MVSAQRRRFLGELGKSACGAVLFGGGLVYVAEKSQPRAAWVIHPPGALAEKNFLGACVRCGLCVRDCPYDTLDLAKPEDSVATGTPYFLAREVPCEMCDDIPCVKACPTGALDSELTDIDDARMGLAVLIDEENCLNFQGLRCDVCYRVCPAIDEAITLEPNHNERTGRHARFLPVVHSDACTGCGKCEYACVLEKAAIKVFPIALAKGELGHHYRWGWQEKEKAGGSLVTPDTPHEYHLPQGLHYEHEGSGLVPATPETTTPFSDNALDTLRRGTQQP